MENHPASFLAQTEYLKGIGLVVHPHQAMFVGKALEVENKGGVGHDAFVQQAVVDENADVLAGKISGNLNVVLSLVSDLFVGIPLEGIGEVEEDSADYHDRNEQYGIENHDIFMGVRSFSAHNSD